MKKGESQGDSFMTVAMHIWFYCLDKWKFPQLTLYFKLTFICSSRSNYFDLHLETVKGKGFFFYASLGYRLSTTIQMSPKELMIELKIVTIGSNWKYDHRFLWSLDLGMSKDHCVRIMGGWRKMESSQSQLLSVCLAHLPNFILSWKQ